VAELIHLRFVEFGEDVAEYDADGCVGYGQLVALNQMESGAGRSPGGAALGVEDPDVLDAEVEVVVDPVLESAEAVFGRENFDGNERWTLENALEALACEDHDEIGDAELKRGNPHAQLGKCFNGPRFPVQHEKKSQIPLNHGVFFFASVSPLEVTGYVVTVGPVTGAEILLYRYMGLFEG
jgi:hypothetical protein